MCLVSTSPNSIYKFSLELGSGVGNQGVSSSSCLPMEELKQPLETFCLAYAWWFFVKLICFLFCLQEINPVACEQ